MLSHNYISGSSVRVIRDVVSVMAAYICGDDTENIIKCNLCALVGEIKNLIIFPFLQDAATTLKTSKTTYARVLEPEM